MNNPSQFMEYYGASEQTIGKEEGAAGLVI